MGGSGVVGGASLPAGRRGEGGGATGFGSPDGQARYRSNGRRVRAGGGAESKEGGRPNVGGDPLEADGRPT